MKTTTKKMRRRLLSLLAVFVLSICTAMPVLAAPLDWTGYADGYYGLKDVNKYVKRYITSNDDWASTNLSVAKVDGTAVTWTHPVYCYNEDRGYPSRDSGTFDNNVPYDLVSWRGLTSGSTFRNIPAGEDPLTFLAKIISSGYPDSLGRLRDRIKNVYGVSPEYVEDFLRYSTQQAIWHCTNGKALPPVKSDPELAVLADGAAKVLAMGAEIYSYAKDSAPTPPNPKLALYKSPNQRVQNLLDTEFEATGISTTHHPVEFLKTDNNNAPLAGASLTIYMDKTGMTLAQGKWDPADVATAEMTWISTKSAKTAYLAPGDYYLAETAAPDGYTPFSGRVKFTVGSAGGLTGTSTGTVTISASQIVVKNNLQADPGTPGTGPTTPDPAPGTSDPDPTTPAPQNPDDANSGDNGRPGGSDISNGNSKINGNPDSISSAASKKAPNTGDDHSVLMYLFLLILSVCLYTCGRWSGRQDVYEKK